MDASFAVNTRNFYAPCASPEECFASWKCIESPLADSSGPRMWRKTSAKAVKQTLAAKVGISRFKDSYWRIVPACSCEIMDDDILAEQLRGSSWSWNSGRLMLKKARRWFRHLGTMTYVRLKSCWNAHEPPMRHRDDGSAPLHHVAQMGHVAPAELLVDAEAQINPLDCFGYTPLFVAGEGNLDIVHLLAENGAAKGQANNYGATPLFVAAAAGHLEIIRFLVEVGAAKDQAKNDGAPPLFVAAVEGLLDIVRFLVEAGAAKKGATPLMAAVQEGNLDIIRLLMESGAVCRLFCCPPKMWCCESGIATNGNLGSVVLLMADIGALPPPKVRRTGDWGSLAQVLSFLQRKTSTPGVQSRG